MIEQDERHGLLHFRRIGGHDVDRLVPPSHTFDHMRYLGPQIDDVRTLVLRELGIVRLQPSHDVAVFQSRVRMLTENVRGGLRIHDNLERETEPEV